MKYLEEIMSSLLVMAWMVEARDPYTGGHLWRVSQYAQLLARKKGWAEVDVARVTVGGFLHDVGKIGVPDHILNKRGALDEREYAVMKTHPELGMRSIAGHPLSKLVKHSVLSHHERPDGAGYPYGLAHQQIHQDARLVAICDAFDAMTSARPYRSAIPKERAVVIVEENLGKQFDDEYGRCFLSLAMEGHFDHIIGHSDEGIPLHYCPICGPTLVLRREQKPGSLVYCPSCHSEFEVQRYSEHSLVTHPTGRKGNAHQLEPEADEALIQRLISEISRSFPLEELLQKTPVATL